MPEKLTPELGHCLALLAELQRIGAALDAASIDYLVLKGVPLAVRLTGRIDGRRRRIRDNDILVHRADAARAVEVLELLGYSPPAGLKLESQLDVNFELEMFRRSAQGTSYCAEAHWAPFSPALYPVSEDYLWSRTEVVRIGDWPARVFDKPTTVVHLASHFVQHGGSFEWVLNDLALAWNTWAIEIDPSELRAVAEQLGLLHVLMFSLRAAEDRGLLTVQPPGFESRPTTLLRLMLPSSRLCTPRPQPDYVRSVQLLALAPTRRIPMWLLQRLIPPRSSLPTRHGDASLEVYAEYARRPLRALRRIARGGP